MSSQDKQSVEEWIRYLPGKDMSSPKISCTDCIDCTNSLSKGSGVGNQSLLFRAAGSTVFDGALLALAYCACDAIAGYAPVIGANTSSEASARDGWNGAAGEAKVDPFDEAISGDSPRSGVRPVSDFCLLAELRCGRFLAEMIGEGISTLASGVASKPLRNRE